MNYDAYIIEVLLEAGERGLTPSKIAHHVHNRVNTFFSQTDYEDVYGYVRAFILRNTRHPYSLLKRTGKWGHYCLNPSSEMFKQQRLKFE